MSLISDWLGYVAWRHGKRVADVRRVLNQRARDEAWKRRWGVSLSKNTITNLLRGRTRDWHEDSKAFVERVLIQDFGVDPGEDGGYELFADTIGTGLLPPPDEAAGR